VGRLITLHDITERKMVETVLAQARDQALEASRLKTRMLANVSHDLRTPLNSILGYAEMLQETASGDDHEILRRVVYNTRQMSFLVNDLLDQSALDSGQLKIHTAFFSPKALLEDTCQIMLPLAQEKGLSLQWVLDPYLPAEITGDSKRLQQVLINLTNNAVKFTDQGTISIRLFLETETSWGMEVSDTGLGIAPEAQIFIFEPFRQAETPAGRKQKGVGLGLSIVKQLVHIMGGNVRVESQVGRGSTFTVSLPLVRPPEGAS
jgi:signal transduction histidine kinase